MRRRTSRLLVVLLVVTALALLVAAIVRHGAAADVAAVTIDNFAFTPASTTITSGSTVTWTQSQNGIMHTVTADDGSFDSGRLATGQIFQQTFSRPGTYAYHCSIHASMHGTVVVTAAAPVASSTAPSVGSAGPATRTYAAGFNLVGVPTGTTLGATAVYAFDSTANGYMTVDPGAMVQGGKGYWAFFDTANSLSLPPGSNAPVAVPAAAGVWYLVGNPSGTLPALITGADAAYTYDAVGAKYLSATMLQPGDGAWALSTHGGTITITPGGQPATPTPSPSPSPTPSPTPQPVATQASTRTPSPSPTPYVPPYTPGY